MLDITDGKISIEEAEVLISKLRDDLIKETKKRDAELKKQGITIKNLGGHYYDDIDKEFRDKTQIIRNNIVR